MDTREAVAGPSKASKPQTMNEIETLLIIHEKKGGPSGNVSIPGAGSDTDSSDSEAESPRKPVKHDGNLNIKCILLTQTRVIRGITQTTNKIIHFIYECMPMFSP